MNPSAPALAPSPRFVLSRVGGLLVLAGLAALMALLSLRFGSVPVSTEDALAALLAYDPSVQHQSIVRTLRLPRTLIGIGVGAVLAISGALMQAATRNPLAGPTILGVSSGATFAVVLAIYYGGLTAPGQYIWFAFAGGLATTGLVLAVGATGSGGASPVKLTLAGVIVSALLGSWTTALLILDDQTFDVVRFWAAGSLAGRDLAIFWTVQPFFVFGAIGGLLLSGPLNVLALGEEQARALGMHSARVRAFSAIAVVAMAGAAVAAAGPIGFVGLAMPHIARALIGPDNRWVVPYAALLGIVLLLGADIAGRIVMPPAEIPVGIITAALGAPFLIVLARRRRIAGA